MLTFRRRFPWQRTPSRAHRRPASRPVFSRPRLEILEDRTLPSSGPTFAVTNLNAGGAGSLAQAVTDANAAGTSSTITFDVTGTIVLSGPLTITNSVTVQGPGAGSISISGNNSTQIFDILGGDVTLSGLTLTDGTAANGAAVLLAGGSLTANNCVFSNNQSAGGNGGAIDATGGSFVALGSDTFQNNSSASGGAVDSAIALTITECTFLDNTALGSTAGAAINGSGGAVFAGNAKGIVSVAIVSSSFTGNQAVGGNSSGGGGSSGQGGALFCDSSVALTVTGSSFTSNQAVGGKGVFGGEGDGGAILVSAGGNPSITNSTFTDNQASGGTSTGGESHGGAGFGGGLYVDFGVTMTLSGITFSGNQVAGGAGVALSNTGTGEGGAIYNKSTVSVSNSTLTGNQASGFVAAGGGLFNEEGCIATLLSVTVAGNQVAAVGGGSAAGSGLDNGFGGTLTLGNSIVALNSGASPANGIDLVGPIVSNGYNLVGNSTGSSGYANTDLLNVEPLLGPLASNGGPTQTLALLAGSPGLGAGDPTLAGTTTDQRGLVRGPVDIGAFNTYYGPTNLSVTVGPTTTAGQTVQLTGSFTDAMPGATHTVDIHWGDGTADTILSLTAGVFTFSAQHTFLDTPGAGSSTVTDTLVVTVSAAGKPPAVASVPLQIINVAPQVQAGSDVLLDLGASLLQAGSFQDPGATAWSVYVSYGDGSGLQVVSLNANQAFVLQHTYTAEGAYVVTVTLIDNRGGTATTDFIVNMLLPGTTNAKTATVPAGTVVTDSAPGVSITLFHSALAPRAAQVLVADVSILTAFSLGAPPSLGPGVVGEVVSYDVRATNVVAGDVAVVTFQYPNNAAGPPTLVFFDRATGVYEPVQGSAFFPGSVLVDPVQHTITLILDLSSTPSLLNLTGTVFTICVPVTVPLTLSLPSPAASTSPGGSPASASSSSSSSSLTSSFLALALLTTTATTEFALGDDEDEVAVVLDLPKPGSSAILLPTVTLSPSQAGLLMEEEEGIGPPPVPTPSAPPALPTPPVLSDPGTGIPPGPSSRKTEDVNESEEALAWVEREEPSSVPGNSLDAALLLSGGLFCLGFEVVPIGTDTERRRRW